MYVVDSKGGAIGCTFLSLIFLGTWPVIVDLLERRGRLPQHTYLDYSITNLLAAVFIALTLGQIGGSQPDMPNFITQLHQDNWPCVLFAMAGGVFLSVGNLATQYAWPLVGISVTGVICSSILVVIGKIINFMLVGRINKAAILFPGVACFLIAVCLGSAVHASNADDNNAKLRIYTNEKQSEDAKNSLDGEKDIEDGTVRVEKAEFGTASFLIETENKRAVKVFGKSTLIGLGLTFFAGLCFSVFSPTLLFNLAIYDQLEMMSPRVPHLVVYTAFFYFSVSCFATSIILNIVFLYYPVFNVPRSSLKDYTNDWNGRYWALLAGLICGFGNGLQFMAGQATVYSVADAVQALPLITTFWGILLLGEYRKSSRRTYLLLGSMLFMFIVGFGILIASFGERKT